MTNFYYKTGKRLLDLALSALGLLLLSPLLAAVGCLVRLTSPGPAFYRQGRVGRGERLFRIAKFRSMYVDAAQRGLQITAAGDSRVTPIGHILRRTKLDELPQLWNVLNGEMSLVGPRPEVPAYVSSYTTEQRKVFSVRPGITDPASVLYRDEEKLLGEQSDPECYYREVVLPAKLKLNLEYVSSISFARDCSLLAKTIVCVLIPRTVSASDNNSRYAQRVP